MNLSKSSLLTALTLGALITLGPVSRAQESKENDTIKPDRPAAGQRERRARPGAQNFESIAERLKLSDDQKAKLQPIFQEETTKLRELRNDTSLTPEGRRDKVRELREQYLAKWKPILTTEQYDQFKKMREQTPARGPRGARQGGGAEGRAPANANGGGDKR